jgi:predicted nucleotidyltransferase
MNSIIEQKREQLAELCRKHQVRRLALFGSALGSEFDPERSDVDLVVEFLPMAPINRFHTYFDLNAALEELFGRPVDLVELGAVQNPYIRRNIESTQVTLYAA